MQLFTHKKRKRFAPRKQAEWNFPKALLFGNSGKAFTPVLVFFHKKTPFFGRSSFFGALLGGHLRWEERSQHPKRGPLLRHFGAVRPTACRFGQRHGWHRSACFADPFPSAHVFCVAPTDFWPAGRPFWPRSPFWPLLDFSGSMEQFGRRFFTPFVATFCEVRPPARTVRPAARTA